ncbi:hypothetical protein D9M71_723060 [compost metagenome]
MMITKQRPLPSTKRMPRHRHRDRNINPNHTHLNLPRKRPRNPTVAGIARHPIPKLMRIDQRNGFSKIMHPHHRQHRPKNLFLVDGHVGLHMIKQRPTDIEPILMPLDLVPPPISHQRRTLFHAPGDIPLNLGLVHPRHQRPHFSI